MTMTRKAGQKSEVTRADLLDAATAEFARRGFQKASLRKICADAGVTTGALYFFFKNKEDLFREVIAPVERDFGKLIELFSEKEFPIGEAQEGWVAGEAVECLAELYENRDAVTVVLNNRDVPEVAGFFSRSISEAEERVKSALEESGQGDGFYDPFLVHWYAHLQVELVLHTIEHSESVKEAEEHMQKMVLFVRGGLTALDSRFGVQPRERGTPEGD